MNHGKHYVDSKKLVDRTKLYDTEEALALCCQTAKAKFDETVELHVRLVPGGRFTTHVFQGMKVGDTLRGSVPALKGAEVELTVYFLSPAGDYATWRSTRQSSGYDVRSFELRARPVGKVDGLRPGMSVLLPWPQR